MHRRFFDKKISFIQILDDLKLTQEAYDKAQAAGAARKNRPENGISRNTISSCLNILIEKVKGKSSVRKRIASNRIGFYLTALDQLLGANHGVKDANMIKEYEDLLLVRGGKVKTSTLSSCLERYIEKVKGNPDTLCDSNLREQIYFEQILYFLFNIKYVLITQSVIKPWEQIAEYEELISLYITQTFCKVLKGYKNKSICLFSAAAQETPQPEKADE